jgi:hypothetical protein
MNNTTPINDSGDCFIPADDDDSIEGLLGTIGTGLGMIYVMDRMVTMWGAELADIMRDAMEPGTKMVTVETSYSAEHASYTTLAGALRSLRKSNGRITR